ncbi:hypothetical protein ACFU8Q_06110 [Streptomyces sp. NPDC057543]|uniref:hypothetical protein n=1 Tax=Streptomyces sp. NPDC057543 TaxID=3346163 RepID=UPI0036BF4BD2
MSSSSISRCGVHPSTGEHLVRPELRAHPRATLSGAQLVEAIETAAGREPLDLFEERRETAQLQALLKARADNPSCPKDPYDYNGDGVVDTTCTGGKRVNGLYGFDIVNAPRAVK